MEPVKLEHDLRTSHLVTIVVPTVIVSVVTIAILVIIIVLLRRKKTVKSSSSAAVISYSPNGKVEITTGSQGHIETLEQVCQLTHYISPTSPWRNNTVFMLNSTEHEFILLINA